MNSQKPADVTELNISLDEVMRLEGIHPTSTVIPDSIQSLADPKSVGYAQAMSAASFDIVNIDLCNSIGNAPPLNEQEGCYEAIRQILDFQRRRRPADQPWVFFLTTRANHGTINANARERFFDCLLRNVHDHADVELAVSEALNLDQARLLAFRSGSIENDTAFENAFAAAVSKWLLQMLGSSPPIGTIKLLPSSCAYSVHKPGSRDMLSLGFMCQTIHAPVHDAAGLAAPGVKTVLPSEPKAAADIIRLVPNLTHVDEILADPEKFEAMVSDTAEFMRSARFDAAKYVEWARKDRQKTASSTTVTAA
ncbi:MAG: hypothetical protein ABUS47_13245 [Steroidobacter sp.]